MGAACIPVLGLVGPLFSNFPQGRAVALVSTLLFAAAFYFSLCLLLRRKEPAIILSSMNPLRRRLQAPEIDR
jgi:hypothetical protein